MGCGASSPKSSAVAYEGALSWSAIFGDTDQATVLAYVKAYSDLNALQLEKAASGDARAATKTRNDLRTLCGPPPVKTPSLAKIRNVLPKTDVGAFDALGVDSQMLGHEFVLMVQKFPDHFDDAEFLCEQLFRKITVEQLVESAEGKAAQRRRSSSEKSKPSSKPSSKPLSTAKGISKGRNRAEILPGVHGTAGSRDGTGGFVDGVDFAAQQQRRGSSASSQHSAGSGGGSRRRRSDTSVPSQPSLRPDVRALPDPNWAPVVAEPLTPRRGSEQSIAAFEREMDTFLEQKRRNSSGSESAAPNGGLGEAHPSQGGPPTPKPVAMSKSGREMYVGAASQGGSFLPPLPDFNSSDGNRRRSGGSASGGSGRGHSAGSSRRPNSSQAPARRHSGSGGGSESEDEKRSKPRRRRSDSGTSSNHHSSSKARSVSPGHHQSQRKDSAGSQRSAGSAGSGHRRRSSAGSS